MKTKHTPRPWKQTVRNYTDGTSAIEISHPHQIGGNEHRLIAELTTKHLVSDDLNKEDRANATLIAASPDLLAALVALVDRAGKKYPHFESERGQGDISTSLSAIASATDGL